MKKPSLVAWGVATGEETHKKIIKGIDKNKINKWVMNKSLSDLFNILYELGAVW